MEVITRKKMLRVAHKRNKEICLELEKKHKDIIQYISTQALEGAKMGMSILRIDLKEQISSQEAADLLKWSRLRGLRLEFTSNDMSLNLSPLTEEEISQLRYRLVDD